MMEADLLPKLRSASKRRQVFEAIETALISGRVRAGQRLVEADLAQQMEVGTPTVREALIDLEHLGFVTRIPNRGTFVTNLTEEDVLKIYSVREVLEGHALQLAKERISPAGIERLRRHWKEMQQAAKAGDPLAFYKADVAFHGAIWEMADNRYLTKMLEILCGPLFADVVTREGITRTSLCEAAGCHERMMNCLAEGTQTDFGKVISTVFEEMRTYDRRIYGRRGEPHNGPQIRAS